MGRGGFDAVIGNPPYIRIQAMKQWAPLEVEFYKVCYSAAKKGNYDIYVVFVEKGIGLLNNQGLLGFILPHKFFNAKYGQPLRALLVRGQHLEKIVYFGHEQVFDGATTYTSLLFLKKSGNDHFQFVQVDDLSAWRNSEEAISGIIPAENATDNEWNFIVGNGAELFEKMDKMPLKLGNIANIFVGLQTSADTVLLFKECQKSNAETTTVYSKELDREVEIESKLLKPVVRSGNIGRYWSKPSALVLFPYKLINEKSQLFSQTDMQHEYPKSWDYLIANKELLSEREHGKFKDMGWYQLYPKNLDLWEQPKIMLPYMITRLSAFYDEELNYFVNVTTGGFGITIDQQCGSMKYVTGLLNSKLLDWFIKIVSTTFHGGYFAANKQFSVQLPIRPIDFSDPEDVSRHDRMVQLVDGMLELNKKLAEANTGHEKTLLQRQIDVTDRQIDRLVYELYDLTEEEIEIVEEASG
jgi:Eco57I restriction endonuclease.